MKRKHQESRFPMSRIGKNWVVKRVTMMPFTAAFHTK